MTQDRYFVQSGDNGMPQEVSKEDYVTAERGAGFYNTLGRPDEPATAGFFGNGMQGRLCYQGIGVPEVFISLEGEIVRSKMPTPQQFHAELLRSFNRHCENTRESPLEDYYSWAVSRGFDHNGWIEHRHGWAITEDLLCGVSLASMDDDEDYGAEVPFEECPTCSKLVELYRDYCAKYRADQAKSRREVAEREGE